jgi:hypothetical protein
VNLLVGVLVLRVGVVTLVAALLRSTLLLLAAVVWSINFLLTVALAGTDLCGIRSHFDRLWFKPLLLSLLRCGSLSVLLIVCSCVVVRPFFGLSLVDLSLVYSFVDWSRFVEMCLHLLIVSFDRFLAIAL